MTVDKREAFLASLSSWSQDSDMTTGKYNIQWDKSGNRGSPTQLEVDLKPLRPRSTETATYSLSHPHCLGWYLFTTCFLAQD